MSDSIDSPFGPETQKYWDRRLEYFSRFDEGVQTDAQGLYSVMPEDAALAQARQIVAQDVVDAFAGIGGNAIGFARAGKKVVAIEQNLDRLNMARSNARIYGVDDRITFIHDDARTYLEHSRGGAVYLDPPWGGPAYKGHGTFLLSYFDPDGRVLIDLTLPRFDEVALRVPRTFDFSELGGLARQHEVREDFSHERLVSRTVYFR